MPTGAGDLPDFVGLYDGRRLTPRMAARLWYVADYIGDTYFDGMAEMWLDELPRIAKSYVDEEFTNAFGLRFATLAQRIADGLEELTNLTTCTADEVALHMIIDRAEELLGEGGLDIEWLDSLPRQPGDDDFYGVKDVLFNDVDVLHLYEPAADGVEDVESDVSRAEGFANLHPRDWFKTFFK